MLDSYLKRYGIRPALISSKAPSNLSICIVIPSYGEGNIQRTLSSLSYCTIPAGISVEVIVVINSEEEANKDIADLNSDTIDSIKAFSKKTIPIHILLEQSLPAKKAGVGLARKIGMDEAARRLSKSSSPIKIICCFDADSTCENSYLDAVYSFFLNSPKKQACSIYFEHPLDELKYEKAVLEGILYYEMHLRYYKNALKYASSPYGFHTIGSSMAVSMEGYIQQGGMNQRKAGEDFYFLQKFMKIGRLGEVKATKVIPSPRASNRVPFGTGRAIQEHLDGRREVNETYAFKSFQLLKELQNSLKAYYSEGTVSKSIKIYSDFVGEEDFKKNMIRIKIESSSMDDFIKRFNHWLDAFQTLKFIHYLRDNYYPNNSLIKAVEELLEVKNKNPKELMEALRALDRS